MIKYKLRSVQKHFWCASANTFNFPFFSAIGWISVRNANNVFFDAEKETQNRCLGDDFSHWKGCSHGEICEWKGRWGMIFISTCIEVCSTTSMQLSWDGTQECMEQAQVCKDVARTDSQHSFCFHFVRRIWSQQLPFTSLVFWEWESFCSETKVANGDHRDFWSQLPAQVVPGETVSLSSTNATVSNLIVSASWSESSFREPEFRLCLREATFLSKKCIFRQVLAAHWKCKFFCLSDFLLDFRLPHWTSAARTLWILGRSGSNSGWVRVRVGQRPSETPLKGFEGRALWRFWLVECFSGLCRQRKNAHLRIFVSFSTMPKLPPISVWGCARPSHANLHQALWSTNPDLKPMWNTFWSFRNLNLRVSSMPVVAMPCHAHIGLTGWLQSSPSRRRALVLS